MKKIMIISMLAFVLGACFSWHNDNYPDPAVAKAEFKKDRAECERRVTEKLQIGVKDEDRSVRRANNRVKFSANYSKSKEFDRCMRIRGWVER